jgi:hypothetical protein
MSRASPLVCLAVCCFALLPHCASAQTPRAEYKIEEERPHTGSFVRRTVARTSKIPINRRYDELTQVEKAILGQDYEFASPGDEPPFPAEGLRPIFVAINKAHEKIHVIGDLFMIVDVGADGEAKSVKAVRSPSPEMAKFVGGLFYITKFKPAVCEGKPCAMQYPFRLSFFLE